MHTSIFAYPAFAAETGSTGSTVKRASKRGKRASKPNATPATDTANAKPADNANAKPADTADAETKRRERFVSNAGRIATGLHIASKTSARDIAYAAVAYASAVAAGRNPASDPCDSGARYDFALANGGDRGAKSPGNPFYAGSAALFDKSATKRAADTGVCAFATGDHSGTGAVAFPNPLGRAIVRDFLSRNARAAAILKRANVTLPADPDADAISADTLAKHRGDIGYL